jgi:hypothetical protein
LQCWRCSGITGCSISDLPPRPVYFPALHLIAEATFENEMLRVCHRACCLVEEQSEVQAPVPRERFWPGAHIFTSLAFSQTGCTVVGASGLRSALFIASSDNEVRCCGAPPESGCWRELSSCASCVAGPNRLHIQTFVPLGQLSLGPLAQRALAAVQAAVHWSRNGCLHCEATGVPQALDEAALSTVVLDCSKTYADAAIRFSTTRKKKALSMARCS